ncbi:unnamed protein product [Closterium sp. NIES-53]
MDAAKRVLRYLCSTSGMGLVLGGRGDVVLTGHSDASWVDDQATQRSSQGYTFSLGSGSVSWRSTRSSSVLSSSCEAEIYATAMAAQELRWLTYLLTDLGERPRSPPVLYLQERGQLRLTYVATRASTADIFTKALLPGDHQRFCTLLGLVPTLPHLLLRGDVVIHLELALHFLTGLWGTHCGVQPLSSTPALCRGPALQLPLSRPCPAPPPGSTYAVLPRRAACCHATLPGTSRAALPSRAAQQSRVAFVEPRHPAEPHRPAEPHCPSACPASTATVATAATAAPAATAAMASPNVLTFDAEGLAHYSSPATAALSRLMLPYLFPDLAAFATIADLIPHLRTGDARYHAALPTEFCHTRLSFGTTALVTPPCLVFEGRQRAAPHSSTFPPSEAPLQTLHMDVWGPACVRGQGHERYFLLVVDDYSRYTTVFPLRSKGEVSKVLIDWIRGARRQLSESFGSDLPVLRLHSDRGGEFSSDLLRACCRAKGIRQTFTLSASP